jgi:hypothetical protein
MDRYKLLNAHGDAVLSQVVEAQPTLFEEDVRIRLAAQ